MGLARTVTHRNIAVLQQGMDDEQARAVLEAAGAGGQECDAAYFGRVLAAVTVVGRADMERFTQCRQQGRKSPNPVGGRS